MCPCVCVCVIVTELLDFADEGGPAFPVAMCAALCHVGRFISLGMVVKCASEFARHGEGVSFIS